MMLIIIVYNRIKKVCFFFFKQKTAYEMRISDWSSDVCSSDLMPEHRCLGKREIACGGGRQRWQCAGDTVAKIDVTDVVRGGQEIGSASCRERVCQYV